jgi:hypothetical protein
MMALVPSIPANVDPTRKVPGLSPSLTVAQWNAVVDVLTAEELNEKDSINCDALDARDAIRKYLVQSGYRNPGVA